MKSTHAHSKTVTRHDSGYRSMMPKPKASTSKLASPHKNASSFSGRSGQINTTKNHA